MDSGRITYWDWKRGLWSLETYTKSLGLLLTAGVRVEQGVVVAREALFQEELGITPEPNEPLLFIEEYQYDYIIELAGDALELILKNDLKNHLLTLNGQESMAFLHRVLDIAKRPQAKNFTKAIIFILGNLDEAYTMSSNYNTDISADEFHDASLKITVPDIKKALRDRFRDEQIARMGNIHIVYPAFSSASFRQLIALELSKTAMQLQEHLDIAFHWDDSLISEIYKEGVYPAQGARPLLTTIHQMVKSKLSTFFNIILDQELEVSSILLRVDKGELIAEFYQNDTRLHSHAQKIHYNLEKLRKPKLDEEQAITAVHEAGHAVLSITLLKVIPDLLVSVSSDTDSAGFMFSKDQKRFISRAELLPQTAVMLGGMLAEELIFGKEHLTSGAASDLERATEQLMKLFKKSGFGSTPIAYARHAFQDAFNYHNTTEIEEEVKALLSAAKQLAEQELIKYESLLLALADYLSEHSRLDKEQLQPFLETYTDSTRYKSHKSNFYRNTLKMRVQTKNVLNESLAKNPVVLNKDRG
jgi:cell division protease FtsH